MLDSPQPSWQGEPSGAPRRCRRDFDSFPEGSKRKSFWLPAERTATLPSTNRAIPLTRQTKWLESPASPSSFASPPNLAQ